MTLSNCYSEETDRYLNNNNLHSCTVSIFTKVSQNKNLHRNNWTVRKQYSSCTKSSKPLNSHWQ